LANGKIPTNAALPSFQTVSKIFSILLLREIKLSGRCESGKEKGEENPAEKERHEGHRMKNPVG